MFEGEELIFSSQLNLSEDLTQFSSESPLEYNYFNGCRCGHTKVGVFYWTQKTLSIFLGSCVTLVRSPSRS